MKADVADSTPVYRTFPDAWLIGPVPYIRNCLAVADVQ